MEPDHTVEVGSREKYDTCGKSVFRVGVDCQLYEGRHPALSCRETCTRHCMTVGTVLACLSTLECSIHGAEEGARLDGFTVC